MGRAGGRKRERPLFHNILLRDETGSRLTMRGVWSCLFLTLVSVRQCCCCSHCHCLRPPCAPSLPAPSLPAPDLIRFQSAKSSGVKACWAGRKADRSSHLSQEVTTEQTNYWYMLCIFCMCVNVTHQPVPAQTADREYSGAEPGWFPPLF